MYGSDFAFWVLSALANGKARETYNVGSPEPCELVSLAHMITRHFSPVPEVRINVGQSGFEPSRIVPDTSKAQSELGLELTVPVSDALATTIRWNLAVSHHLP
jgi:nucleoside-diphosphate-sugar epimerase